MNYGILTLHCFCMVSTASVAKKLGHIDMTTIQSTYLHIIEKLGSQNNDKIMRHFSIGNYNYVYKN